MSNSKTKREKSIGNNTMGNDNSHPDMKLDKVSRYFGTVIALNDITFEVFSGKVTCLLGDNGAGKSTLIKTLAGVHQPSEGKMLMDGNPLVLKSPRDALDKGIATVYQDLALVPLMSIGRNFFMGREPLKRLGPFKVFDTKFANQVAKAEMAKIGINIRSADQAVGTLSGGERQSLAIARAIYFAKKILIFDEPTAALGVKQSRIVLDFIKHARDQQIGVVFITHNSYHAYEVGDYFYILNRGRTVGNYTKENITRDRLFDLMAGKETAKD